MASFPYPNQWAGRCQLALIPPNPGWAGLGRRKVKRGKGKLMPAPGIGGGRFF